MKQQIFVLGFCVMCSICLRAQPTPEILWQKTIGGNSSDWILDASQTSDMGYILGGSSASEISEDKAESSSGLSDYWVVKLDSIGNIMWEKTFGGDGEDFLFSIQQTDDAGYFLGGYSNSNISGDKTENSIANTRDYWVIKLDSAGNILWQNTIGGGKEDDLISTAQTSDKGYILGGYSNSKKDNDKSEGSHKFDYWVVKLDSVGNILWQNTIGGSGDDYLFSIQQIDDSGYILGGFSSSGISGDKTEINIGGSDYWVVKLDSLGNVVWQNTIGGDKEDILNAVKQTSDKGYLLGGYSDSGISGDKTEINIGGSDYWVVKLDSMGNIAWQNDIGGDSEDFLFSIMQTINDEYILAGTSYSTISGDKTSSNVGEDDYWVMKLDRMGNIEWQKTLGGSSVDVSHSIIENADGSYLVSGYSSSNISGVKTSDCIGGLDFWVIKLHADCAATLDICNGLDDNCNGLIDETQELIEIFAEGSTTFCKGGSVVLKATSSLENFQWKRNDLNIPGENNSEYTAMKEGIYRCEASNFCSTAISSSIYVNVQKSPMAMITANGPTTFCPGDSVTLSGTSGIGLAYQWYNGSTLIPEALEENYTAISTGNYKCKVSKIATGCSKFSNTIFVSTSCRNEYSDNSDVIKVFPNPTKSYFIIEGFIDIMTENVTIEIYNNIGQLVYSKVEIALNGYLGASVSLNESLSPGLYTIKIKFGKSILSHRIGLIY